MTDLSKYRERLATEVMGWVDEHLYDVWCPDEDVGQAIQLLETFSPDWTIERDDALDKTYVVVRMGLTYGRSAPLPAAIVSAVVRALGWDSE